MASTINEFKRGWAVLLACFLGIGVSLVSLIYYSGGIWIKPWQEAFGWTRAEIGLGQGLSTMTIVLGAPFAGWLIDKYGLKKVATLSLILYGGCIYLISQMNGSLIVFYALFILLALLALPSTPLGFTRVINAWFEKNRGLALGISLTSTGFGAYFVPKYLTPYVDLYGWEEGYFLLFVIVMIAVPIIWLLLKNEPTLDQQNLAEVPTQTGVTFKSALRTVLFWKIASIFFLISIAIIGLIPSFIPLLQDAGLSAAEAGSYAAILGLSVMLGRLLTGFLIDRIFAPYITAVVFIFVASGCLALGIGGVQYALWGALALGFAIGAEVDLIGYYTAQYFGLKHYGSIYGAQYSVFSAGGVFSSVIAGYIWDTTGNYDLALKISAGLIIGAVVIVLTLPKFPKLTEG